jgi:hypothetical protein
MSEVILQNLTAGGLIKTVLDFFEDRRFITVFTKAYH